MMLVRRTLVDCQLYIFLKSPLRRTIEKPQDIRCKKNLLHANQMSHMTWFKKCAISTLAVRGLDATCSHTRRKSFLSFCAYWDCAIQAPRWRWGRYSWSRWFLQWTDAIARCAAQIRFSATQWDCMLDSFHRCNFSDRYLWIILSISDIVWVGVE